MAAFPLPTELSCGYMEATPMYRPRLLEGFLLLIRINGEWRVASGLRNSPNDAEACLAAHRDAEAWRVVRIANLPLPTSAEQV